MAKFTLLPGQSNQTMNILIQDSSKTNGDGLTGLTASSSGLVAYYTRPGAVATQITLASGTPTGGWISGGFCEIDAVAVPGLYRLDPPSGVTAVGVNTAQIMLRGAVNMAACTAEIELDHKYYTRVNWAQTAASSYITLDTGANASSNTYKGQDIRIIQGPGSSECREIIYYDGSNKKAYIHPPWINVPTVNSLYGIIPNSRHSEYIHTGIAQGGNINSLTLDSGASPNNDTYKSCTLEIVGGAGVGQSRLIYDYVGATRSALVHTIWNTLPDNTSIFRVKGVGVADVGMWLGEQTLGSDYSVNKIPLVDIGMISTDQNAADALERLMEGANLGSVDPSAFSSTTTQFECTLTETDDDHFNNQCLRWGQSASNAGLSFFISDSQGTSANPNGKVRLTLETMPNAPSSGDVFEIIGKKPA